MSAFTAGPWCRNNPYSDLVEDKKGTIVANCWISGRTAVENIANATLIEASPDLLEALKLLLIEVELSGNADAKEYGWPVAVAKSRAAILRATPEAG